MIAILTTGLAETVVLLFLLDYSFVISLLMQDLKILGVLLNAMVLSRMFTFLETITLGIVSSLLTFFIVTIQPLSIRVFDSAVTRIDFE
jgi:hypothetical protein